MKYNRSDFWRFQRDLLVLEENQAVVLEENDHEMHALFGI